MHGGHSGLRDSVGGPHRVAHKKTGFRVSWPTCCFELVLGVRGIVPAAGDCVRGMHSCTLLVLGVCSGP